MQTEKLELENHNRETFLIKTITEATPTALQNHYLSLAQKLHEEIITPTEHKELLELVDIIEAQKVERLKNLIELSELRNVSLDSLMEELNLNYCN